MEYNKKAFNNKYSTSNYTLQPDFPPFNFSSRLLPAISAGSASSTARPLPAISAGSASPTARPLQFTADCSPLHARPLPLLFADYPPLQFVDCLASPENPHILVRVIFF